MENIETYELPDKIRQEIKACLIREEKLLAKMNNAGKEKLESLNLEYKENEYHVKMEYGALMIHDWALTIKRLADTYSLYFNSWDECFDYIVKLSKTINK